MSDFGDPVAQNVDVNPMHSLSQVLDIRSRQQGLQGQAAEVQQQQIKARTDAITQREQMALGQISPEQFTKDGVLDAPAFARAVQAATPFSGLGQARALRGYEVQNSQLTVQRSAQELNEAQRKDASSALAGVAADPKATYADVVSAADQYKKQNPAAARVMDTMLQQLSPGDPIDGTKKKIMGLSRAMLGASELSGAGGLNTPAPAIIDNGAQQQPGAISRTSGAFTPAGAPIANQVGPGVSILTDARGAQYSFNPQNNTVKPVGTGGASSAGAVPTSAPAKANPNAFQQPAYQGQAKDIEANQSEVRAIRQQGDQAPLNRNINQNILRLSADAKTGPGSEAWQHVIGALGTPLGLSPTASYQEVGKYLEKNAINNMQAMGAPGSDARLSAAAAANGSTHFSKEALQDVTKFNDATNTALIKYRQGIDQAIGTRNPNYTDLPRFKGEWAKNFDVNIFRVENALRDGDQQELQKIKKELGPAQMRELAEKRRNLEALSANGELPHG